MEVAAQPASQAVSPQVQSHPSSASFGSAVAVAEAEVPVAAPPVATTDVNSLRDAVLAELEGANQGMLANMLAGGEWAFTANEVKIACAVSAVFVDMSLGAEAKKLVDAAIARAAGRRLKLSVIGMGANGAKPAHSNGGGSHSATAAAPSIGGGGARSRAADDPLVQYMRDKFKGEIRTVIDKRNGKKS
jgi:hypothetical protein